MNERILIIDDDRDLSSVLRKYLELEGYLVSVSYDGIDGLKQILSSQFQLIVLDVMLPQKNGFEVLLDLRKTSNVPVLMLTAKDSEIDKVSGLRLGADDYLTKPFSINELLARVGSLIRRYTALNGENSVQSSKTLCFDGLEITLETREVLLNGKNVELTAKEFELLYFLASNQGKIFTKNQIYTQVWGNEYAYDDNNIMSFISKLRKKIESNHLGISYIQTVRGVGYRFKVEVQ